MPVVASFMYRDGKRAEDLPLSPHADFLQGQ